jgi:23S rRNA (adenine1618-N6)-methyltransferase
MADKKNSTHPKNKHQGLYDFDALIKACPALKKYVKPNKFGDTSIDFSDPKGVKTLNRALLALQYNVKSWNIPHEYLVPPIPGRADYIHYVAAELLPNQIGSKVTILDIGTGASLIYPIIGTQEYGWKFIASDIDEKSIHSCQQILNHNAHLKNIELRHQKNSRDTFFGIVESTEKIQLSICNPPFHASMEDAQRGTLRKVNNLSKGVKVKSPKLNFGGTGAELVTDGGEKKFICNMIRQSKRFSENIEWFSSLVSKEVNVKPIISALRDAGVKNKRIIEMGQGNKVSRIICWKF